MKQLLWSRHKGGVQALLQQRLHRVIPYVHCCNHRLHLVLVKAIKDEKTKNYSATKKSLYKTGGGSKESIIGMETPVDAVVHDIIGARITGYESVWDSDNVVSSMFGI
jgi:hypothetical protein